MPNFYDQVLEVIESNHWEKDFEIIKTPKGVRIQFQKNHPFYSEILVGEYDQDLVCLEQILNECLRASRTGRTGSQ